jgi:murein L,D-transpeptidase YafK
MSSASLALALTLVLPLAGSPEGASAKKAGAKGEPARVKAAREKKGGAVVERFRDAGVAYPARELLLRAFKAEGVLEVWAGEQGGALTLVMSFPICASSGVLGPKRAQGDLQVPEGFYAIDALNPWSSYHLSLHVDYPNRADRIRGQREGVKDLGGAIMVHGNCVTIGCIPIEDGPIEEVYLLVHDARQRRARVGIHIFPARLDAAGLERLAEQTGDEALLRFWREELAPGYLAFEESRRTPQIAVDEDGRYVLRRSGPDRAR